MRFKKLYVRRGINVSWECFCKNTDKFLFSLITTLFLPSGWIKAQKHSVSVQKTSRFDPKYLVWSPRSQTEMIWAAFGRHKTVHRCDSNHLAPPSPSCCESRLLIWHVWHKCLWFARKLLEWCPGDWAAAGLSGPKQVFNDKAELLVSSSLSSG